MNVVVSVGGIDPCGYAGLQVDMRTFLSLGLPGKIVIATVTAQTVDRFRSMETVSADMVIEQLQGLRESFTIDALKTGLLAAPEIVRMLAAWCADTSTKIIVDPIFRTTSGREFGDELVDAYREFLLPEALVITPNVHEAECLSGIDIVDGPSRERAARSLARRGTGTVIVTGGHFPGSEVTDLIVTGEESMSISGPRIEGDKWRGAGCTFSAAITAFIATGHSIEKSARLARRYVTAAMRRSRDAGDNRMLRHPVDSFSQWQR